jgi:hypothetical protein
VASEARMNGRFAASFCSFCRGEIVLMEKFYLNYNDILLRPNNSNTLVAVYLRHDSLRQGHHSTSSGETPTDVLHKVSEGDKLAALQGLT